MKIKQLLSRLFIACTCLALNACESSINFGLKLDSVSLISDQNEKSLGKKYGDIKISFFSEVDIEYLSVTHNFNITYQVYLCDSYTNNIQEIPSRGSVFTSKGKIIYPFNINGVSYTPSTPKPRPNYFVAFPYKGTERDSGYKTFSGYNLEEDNRNLCLKLTGGAMFGRYFDSEILIVPNKDIKELLKKGAK